MKRTLKHLSALIISAFIACTASICAFAAEPADNGSNAKNEMLKNGYIAAQTEESTALPGWLAASAAGAAVLVGVIITGAIVSGRRKDSEENK